MDEHLRGRWRVKVTFFILAIVIVFVQTFPSNYQFSFVFLPDVMLCITYAWVIRRPDAITPLAIVGVVLLSDFLLQRPPGLWTLFVLLGTIFLHSRMDDIRHTMFITEWLLVGVVICGAFLMYQIMLIVTFSYAIPWNIVVVKCIMTVISYPLIVLISHRIFKLDRLSAVNSQNI